MPVKFIKLLLSLVAFVAFSGVAGAQWVNVERGDTTVAPVFHEVTVTAADIATTITLLANSSDNVVDNYDISSGTTVSSITQPLMPRSLGGYVLDAAGSTLTGYIEIRGTNQNGLGCYDKIVLPGGSAYFLTKNAYQTITSITYTLSNNTTNDKLRIGTVGWGIPRCNMNTPDVVVHYDASSTSSSARVSSDDWYFDNEAQVLRANKETGASFPTIAGEDKIQVFGRSTRSYGPWTSFVSNASATLDF